jgi:SAM-dependent methyltransferase
MAEGTIDPQIAYWNGPGAERWLREQERLDAMLRPYGEAAIEAAHLVEGEAVIDVGCGCGTVARALAARVGARGRVVGVDVSAPMLARARQVCADLPGISFVEGDATAVPLERGGFDVIVSRFGVIFFVDPVRAFRHLRGALRGAGRLAFVCWRSLEENPWASVPFEAVTRVLGRPEPPPQDAPGPFSFGDDSRVRTILESAGFADVRVRAFDAPVAFGSSNSLEQAALEMAQLGPVARLLADRDEAASSLALAAIRGVIVGYARDGQGFVFPGGAWVATARNAS